MKSDYRVRAMNFLRSIFPYIEGYMWCVSEVEERVDEYNRDRSRHVEVACGSARIALITSDYVIKWDYDEDCVSDIGGCDDERRAYEAAIKDGYAYLLAEITMVDFRGYRFGIMPRIRNVGPDYHGGDIKEYLTYDEYAWLSEFDKDIHHYNWGIRHGKPCVIDYALTREVMERGNWEG